MRLLSAVFTILLFVIVSPAQEFPDDAVHLVVRCDDMGFTHASNLAFERVLEEGVVTSISVLVTGPWFEEAVEILERFPDVSVGVHLCLNCEWENLHWGPILPADEVPSLVDEWGHFIPTRALFNEADPSLEEIDAELRAQVDLALARGLDLSYIDHHMGTAGETPERRAILEGIAMDYGLGISRWFGEGQVANAYFASPEAKADVVLDALTEIDEPGLYLAVFHPGLDVPEMADLRDVHPFAPVPMAAHRQAETDLLCEPSFRALIEERGFQLIGYRELRADHSDLFRNPDWEVPVAPLYDQQN